MAGRIASASPSRTSGEINPLRVNAASSRIPDAPAKTLSTDFAYKPTFLKAQPDNTTLAGKKSDYALEPAALKLNGAKAQAPEDRNTAGTIRDPATEQTFMTLSPHSRA